MKHCFPLHFLGGFFFPPEKGFRESKGNPYTGGALAAATGPLGSGVPEGLGTIDAALIGKGAATPHLSPAKDDLRAYAYEGDGSSAGSLTSALAGL